MGVDPAGKRRALAPGNMPFWVRSFIYIQCWNNIGNRIQTRFKTSDFLRIESTIRVALVLGDLLQLNSERAVLNRLLTRGGPWWSSEEYARELADGDADFGGRR